MKAEIGDYIVYRTDNASENESDLFGLVYEVNENVIGIFCGVSLDSAKPHEIYDIVRGSEASRQLVLEYMGNLKRGSGLDSE